MIRQKITRPKISNRLGGWTKLFLDSEYTQKYVADTLKVIEKEMTDLPKDLNIRVFVGAAQIVNGTNIYLEYAILNSDIFVQSTLYIPPGKEAIVKQLFLQKSV